jgi:hypothetical protein
VTQTTVHSPQTNAERRADLLTALEVELARGKHNLTTLLDLLRACQAELKEKGTGR